MNILHEIYAKLETLDTVSSKLDMLPVIIDRLLSLENRVQEIQAEIVGIKTSYMFTSTQKEFPAVINYHILWNGLKSKINNFIMKTLI
jgi:hypothetical protein